MCGTAFDLSERRIWDGRAEAYARTFARLCAHPVPALLDAAGVGAGTQVLDAGCGSGGVTVAAVGRGAVVRAVDAEPGMVEATRRAAPGVDVRLGRLPELPYGDGGFDAEHDIPRTPAGPGRRTVRALLLSAVSCRRR